MSGNYVVILTKCPKCDKSYLPRREFDECPHNFRDKLSRQMTGQEKSIPSEGDKEV